MPQIKVSLDEANLDFVSNYQAYGFASKSAIVDAAISNLKQTLEQQQLIESAELYQEVYDNDLDLQELTDDAASLCLE